MVIQTPFGNRALQSGVDARGQMFVGVDAIPLPAIGTGLVGSYSSAGKRVTPDIAIGLPAVLDGVIFIAETTATLPLMTYRRTDGKRVREESPQSELLNFYPNDVQSPFDFMAFIGASIEGWGNAFILKAKTRRKGVVGLYPLDPRRVQTKTTGTTVTYKILATGNTKGSEQDLTRDDILHIPGFLWNNPFVGSSQIMVAANSVGGALGAQEFADRLYDNDSTPAGVITIPGGAGSQKARDMRELWEDRHRGSSHAHRTGVLFDGATYQSIGISPEASQLLQTRHFHLDEIARMLRLPSWALGGVDPNPRSTPEERNTQLIQFSFNRRWIRIAQGLHRDDDLFPSKQLVASFDYEELLRADILQRYQAYTFARQAGWLSVNDIRFKEGLPEVGGGDDYQQTPVGGAPNLQPGDATPPKSKQGGDGEELERALQDVLERMRLTP